MPAGHEQAPPHGRVQKERPPWRVHMPERQSVLALQLCPTPYEAGMQRS
jgi:hypothetical protein